MSHKHRTGLSRLGRYLRGRWLMVAWLIVVATGSAAAQSGGWLLVRDAIDNGIAKGDRRTLTVVVAVYLVVNLLGWLCQVTLIRGLARIGQGIVLGLRRDLFDHLTSLSLRYFSEQRAGWIIARVTSDVDAISDALSQGLPTLVSNVVLLPTTVIVLFIVDWRLALVAMVILPPTLVVTRWFQVKSSVAQLEVRNRIAAVTAQVAESVSGMAIIQAFNRERHFQSQFDELNLENRTANIYAQKLFSVFFPSIELLGAISTCAVLVLGAHLLAEGTLTIGTLITAIYLLQLVFQPLQELSDVYGQVQAAAAAMIKVSSVLDTEIEIGDRAGARPIGTDRGPHRPRRRALLVRRHRGPARHRHPRAGRRVHRPGGPDRRRQVDARQADRPLLRPAGGVGARRRHRPARGAAAAATGASSAWCSRTRSCSRARSPTTCASPARTQPTRRCARPPRRSASTGSWPGCRADSTTPCARAARACRRASAS